MCSCEQFPILFPPSAINLSLDNFRRKAQVWQAFPGTASQTALGIYKVKQQENSLSQWETFFAPARTSNIKTPGPLTRLAEHREEAEINGTLNPIKLEREAWGCSLFFSGDAANPHESKGLRRPSALEETHTAQNLNDSFLSIPSKVWVCVCVSAQFKVFPLMSLQVWVKYSLLDAVLCVYSKCGCVRARFFFFFFPFPSARLCNSAKSL